MTTTTTAHTPYTNWAPAQIAAAIGTPADGRMAAAERDHQNALDALHQTVNDKRDAHGRWVMTDRDAVAAARSLFSGLSGTLSRLDGAARQFAALTALHAEQARRAS